ncbi:MAG: hypothetical protein PHR77_02460 [Kiritimatiellae bacterium]|nr:hypothetical protein [Kiritimatiellia bacterium]MDD5519786.1 hypothetical protein [Kiritimatiellia bacterium]
MKTNSLPAGKTLSAILDDFQPELAEWSVFQGMKKSDLSKHRYFPRFISGGIEYQEYEAKGKDWERLFHTDWAVDEEHGVAMDLQGNPIRHMAWGGEVKNGSRWNVCHNAPKWHELQKESVVRLAKYPGITVVRQDNIGVPVGITAPGCYCRWCKAGLRKLLAARFTADELRIRSITDLNQFDIARYLVDHKLLGNGNIATALEDPIVIAWEDFVFTSNFEAWCDIVAATKAVREMPICGNQGCANMNAWSSVVLSQPNDVIFLEQWTQRGYPAARLTLGYKVQCAAGRHAKPVWIWGFPTQNTMEQVVGSEIFIAECYANQATPYFLINNYFWSKATGTQVVTLAPKVYDAVTSYAQFARAHKELLTRVHRGYADVALVYSVPSFLYKVCSAMQFYSGNGLYQRQAANLEGMAHVLERSNVPYDVVVFGSPGYWNDDDLVETLNRYKVVIMPNVECMTEKQAEALNHFLRNGGHVIVSGDLGVRDDRYRRREKPLLEGDLNGRMVRLGDAAEALTRALHEKIRTEAGAHQRLILNQQAPKAIVFRGWSRAEKVSGHTDSDYSIYLDITFQDGSSLWAQTANFATGTHDWQMAQSTVEVDKPVKTVDVLTIFRRRTGKVWFDDVFVGEAGNDRNLLGDWQPYRNGFQRDSTVTRSGKPAICCVIAPGGPVNTSQIDGFKRITEALRNAMSDQTPVLEMNAPATVAVNPVLRGDHLIVHLLNYDCDPDAETLAEKRDVKVRVRLPKDTKPGLMTLCVPGSPDTPLQAKASGQFIEFTVPQIRVWAIVHCNLVKP